MDIDTLQGLRRCPLFNGLTESEIIDLMHTVRYRVVRCCKGEFHAIEGSVCQYADIIIQGEMVASMMVPSKALFANMLTSLFRARWWQA